MLKPGNAYRLTWSDGTVVVARPRAAALMLDDTVIKYALVPRHYGPSQAFECPKCSRAAFKLFLAYAEWACYACHRIVTPSMDMEDRDRHRYRAQGMLERLQTRPAWQTKVTRRLLPEILARVKEMG
jgi:hypothetical protein